MHLVDCGSGSCRLVHLRRDRGEAPAAAGEQAAETSSPGRVHKTKLPWRGEALAVAITDEAKASELVEQVRAIAFEGPVLFGATAGLRAALEAGAVSEEHVARFRKLIQGILGDRGRFEVLSGEEEACAEWEAVAYELRGRLSEVHALAGCAGMLSGGGMSSQLALAPRGGEPALCFGFQNHVLDPTGLVGRVDRGELRASSLPAALAEYAAFVAERLQGMPTGLIGTFVAIEWTASYIADPCLPTERRLGLGLERVLPRSEVLATLEAHLAAERAVCVAAGEGDLPRPAVLALVYGTLLQAILTTLFGEEASFFCVRGIDWTLGHYLKYLLESSKEGGADTRAA